MKDDTVEREAAVTQINAVLFPRALASALAIDALILLCLWGQWRAFFVGLTLMAVQGFFNGPPIASLQRRVGTSVGEAARSIVNVSTILCLGHLIHWQLPIWAYVAYFALPMIGLHDRQGPVRLFLTVAVIDVVGVASGSDLWPPVVFSLLAMSAWGLIDIRTKVIRQLYLDAKAQRDELDAAHRELKGFHERAVAQEKLAGLGLLAAGIAHEINNPMGYVTSNVSALADDIRRLPSDPALLEEYAAEVLPSTLNGIERVDAIVTDLRRFARGDLEHAVAFDLNAEVSAALRIVQNQLKYHCTVEVALGTLPMLSGRPQQMAQVIVNLLVNAGKAMPLERQGRLCVSTQVVGGEVLLTVKDDGAGMSPATMQKLFQPFFTTKAVGDGMGLGLSVVHGIVKAHGGHIEVSSELGKGSSFAVHLPVGSARKALENAAWHQDASAVASAF